jgi:hypothetical protein
MLSASFFELSLFGVTSFSSPRPLPIYVPPPPPSPSYSPASPRLPHAFSNQQHLSTADQLRYRHSDTRRHVDNGQRMATNEPTWRVLVSPTSNVASIF